MQRTGQFSKTSESEVWSAIAAFEQILEAMPEDRTALETLYEAYDHIGDKSRALEHLVRLADQVAEEADGEAAAWIVEALQRRLDGGPEVRRALAGLERMLGRAPASEVAASGPAPGRASHRRVDIASELALAWNLLQAEVISRDEYAQIAQDLTENSTKKVSVPVSVLHVLHDRGYKNEESLAAFLSRDGGLPVVSLADFDPAPDCAARLPEEFLSHRGALPFETLGGETLVAVLNPYNTELRREVERLIGQRCHFFLAMAPDYDRAIERLRKAPAGRG